MFSVRYSQFFFNSVFIIHSKFLFCSYVDNESRVLERVASSANIMKLMYIYNKQ